MAYEFQHSAIWLLICWQTLNLSSDFSCNKYRNFLRLNRSMLNEKWFYWSNTSQSKQVRLCNRSSNNDVGLETRRIASCWDIITRWIFYERTLLSHYSWTVFYVRDGTCPFKNKQNILFKNCTIRYNVSRPDLLLWVA